MKFTSSICLIGPSMADTISTGKEKQHPHYTRKGDKQTVTTEMSQFSFTEEVQDAERGTASLKVKTITAADTALTGVFVCFELPADDFAGAGIQLIDSNASKLGDVPLVPVRSGKMPQTFRARNFLSQALVKGFRVTSATRTLEVRTEQPTEIIIQKGTSNFGSGNDRIYLAVMTGRTKDSLTAERTFSIKISGEIDRSPVQVSIDAGKPGRAFDGIGGNFRIQNEKLDPQVIDYCLDHLNVRWARVEMPWRSWHPVESVNPLEAARAGKLDASVRGAMEMAQRLTRRHIPVIVSAWVPPQWAIVGEVNVGNENGIYGNPLNQKKIRSIIKSIGYYFVYLKQAYGVEPALFSFNESDLGINLRMTGQEHADFIKKLGAFLASQELSTKMLLGDNSDATTVDFIQPALDDPATHQYIGAISFHAWRGCDDWTLSNWGDAARELNAPLLIAEGGTDAHAYLYPAIFQEPAFAMDEIDIYVRAINIAHVRAILQWQLTSDYSLLSGEGLLGNQGELKATQRFWNLKQLGMLPAGSFILPTTCSNKDISCAAFADIAGGTYTIDLVNHGASRPVRLTGFPDSVKELRVYITDGKRGMEEGNRVRVENGEAKFTIDEFSFTTLVGVR